MTPTTVTGQIVALLRQHLTPRDTPLIMFHCAEEPTSAVICTHFGWKTFKELKRTILFNSQTLKEKNYGRIVFSSVSDKHHIYNSARDISMSLAFDNLDRDASDNKQFHHCIMYLPPGWSIRVDKQDKKDARCSFETIKIDDVSWYERSDDEFKTELREALATLDARDKEWDAGYVIHHDDAHAMRANELIKAALPNNEWHMDTFKAGVRIHLTRRSTCFDTGYRYSDVYCALHPQDYVPPNPESPRKKGHASDDEENDDYEFASPYRKSSPLPEGKKAFGVFAHAAYGQFVFPRRSLSNNGSFHTIAENQPMQATAFWHTSNADMNELADAEQHRDKRTKQE